MTTEANLSELVEQIRTSVINTLTLPDLIAQFSPEELVAHLTPEKLVTHLTPEERLSGLTIEERLTDLAAEQVLVAYQPFLKRKSLLDGVIPLNPPKVGLCCSLPLVSLWEEGCLNAQVTFP